VLLIKAGATCSDDHDKIMALVGAALSNELLALLQGYLVTTLIQLKLMDT
jgi:hypothetical protein